MTGSCPLLVHFPQPGTPGLTRERYFAAVDDVVFHGTPMST